MNPYILYQVDAFTRSIFKGNPAGVVVNADGLSESRMQDIARELNNSETAFLFPPDGPDCDGIIRYFTPTTEVPTCGHATIAAMVAKAMEEDLPSCILQMKTKIGVLPFEIIKIRDRYRVTMTQGPIKISPPLSPDNRSILLKALGINEKDIDQKYPIQIASTGHGKVMVGIKKKMTLNRMTPDMALLKQLSHTINCNGYYVFTFDPSFDSEDLDILVHGRMFAPAIGIAEDPVTGNANGPLGAYLVHNKLVDTRKNLFQFKAKQGQAMGRPGIIDVLVTIEDQQPTLVQIAGEAVVVFKTTLEM